MEKKLRFEVTQAEQNKTIKYLLKQKLKMSTRQITRLKQNEKGILLNGNRVFVSAVLSAGDVLLLSLEEATEGSASIKPVKGQLDILYEDEDILVLNKEPGLVVHPTKGHYSDTLANRVMWYYQNKGQNFVFRCVTRLDDSTSGAMAVAKNAYAHQRLQAQMKDGTLIREYLALASGMLSPKEGTIDAPVDRISPDRKKRQVCSGGKQAVTHYRTLWSSQGISLLRLRLETGRTHQIRVHLSHIGHPLLGDTLYGGESSQIDRPALHSASLQLLHPVSEKKLRFTVPMPADFIKFLFF